MSLSTPPEGPDSTNSSLSRTRNEGPRSENAPSNGSTGSDGPRPIVGIGASAGGVEALQRFFRALPAESGMAFVVVLHLASDYESNLASILAQRTEMPVEEVTASARVRSDHVYAISPGCRLEIDDGCLQVTPTEEAHEASTIDRFFRSLATDQGENGVGVVLSGRGTDGSLGLREIKNAGGVVLAQSPEDAGHESMPQSAIQTGLVDLVAPAAELAETLAQYRDRAGTIQLPKQLEDLGDDGRTILQKIFARLDSATGHDFSGYRRATVLRRLERRLQLSGTQSLEAYLRRLRRDETETRTLYKDLLIGVTSFFRDPEAFAALAQQVIPRLFEPKTGGDEVRVWVPGCATGEEAYTIAMLLVEHADALDRAPEVQLFATDVDEEALEIGRAALYPKPITEDLSEERLARFFEPEGDHYRIRRSLRDRVLFAKHDLLTDPPFSRLDLVSCRNVLIYLTEEMQENVLGRIHYGLRDGGYLLLGRAEASSRAQNLFVPLDERANLFEARPLPEEKRPGLPFAGTGRSGTTLSEANLSTQARSRSGSPTGARGKEAPRSRAEGRDPSPPSGAAGLADIHRRALMASVASMLVNEKHEIVHLSGQAARYLQFQKGTPTLKLLPAMPEALRPELTSALYQAFENGAPTCRSGLIAELDGDTRRLTLRVEPIDGPGGQPLALVRLEESAAPGERSEPREHLSSPTGETGEPSEDAPGTASRPEDELEAELRRTREQLQTTSEEYEAASEEMEAANEELLSLNEELRSKNAELESSKEELQSVNEELKTTNQELKAKIEEVREANSVLENLMTATRIATLFLDRNLKIQRFTPRATELFNIRPEDVGRPLADFTQRFAYEDLIADARTVLDELRPLEREIHRTGEERGAAAETTDAPDSGEKWFLLRIHPYRTVEDKIDGVVLTFIDITERRKAEQALRESEARLETFLEQLPVGAGMIDDDGKWVLKNPALDRYVSERLPSQTPSEHERWRARRADGTLVEPENWPGRRALRGETVSPGMDFLYVAEDGTERWTRVSAAPFRDADDEIKGAIIVVQDIHDRKQAEEALRRSEEFHRLAAEAAGVGTWDINLETRECFLSETMGELLGFAPDEHPSPASPPQETLWQQVLPLRTCLKKVHPEDRPRLKAAIAEAEEWETPLEVQFRVGPESGPLRWLYAKGEVTRDAQEDGLRLRGAALDVTERHELEEAVVNTSEKVRRDIGRELHDVLSSDLAALAIRADNLARTLAEGDVHADDASPDEIVEAVKRIAEGVRSAATQSRTLSHVLMPAVLQEGHLAAALENLCREQAELSRPAPTFEGDREEPLPEDPEAAMHLFRIAREAVTNAQRHAEAEHIRVRLTRERNRLVLTVRDDGQGLPDEADAAAGIGLRTMEHRADLIGAILTIESPEEGGTVVQCTLPVSTGEGE